MSAGLPRAFLLRLVGSRLQPQTARLQRQRRRHGADWTAARPSGSALAASRCYSASVTSMHSLTTEEVPPRPAPASSYFQQQQQPGQQAIMDGESSHLFIDHNIEQQSSNEELLDMNMDIDPTITTNELMYKMIHTIDQWPKYAFTQHLTKFLQHHRFTHSIEVLVILRTCDFYSNIDAAILTLRTALKQQQQRAALQNRPTANQSDVTTNPLVNEPIYGIVINLAAKCRRYDLAKELLFDAETHNHVTVNSLMWNMVFKAGIRQGAYVDVLLMFKKMQAKNYEPTVVTYNTILNACAKNHDWLTALDIFDQVLKDEARYNAAVDQQASSGVQKTETIPPPITPDLLTFNTVIHACSKKGKWQTAREIADKMPQYLLRPDRMTYNNLIQACIRGGVTKYAYQIFEAMQQQEDVNLQPDLATNTLILQAAVAKGEYQKVVDTYHNLQQTLKGDNSDRDKVDMLMLNTVLTSYIRLCDFDAAFTLITTMRQRYRLTPDTKLLTSLMRSSSHRRQPEECEKLLKWCLKNVNYRVDWRMLDLALMSCSTVHHLDVFERLYALVETQMKQLKATWTPAMVTSRITMYEVAGNYQGIVDLCQTFINDETAYGKQSAIVENLAITTKAVRAGALVNNWSFVNRWLTYMQFIYRPQRALRLIHRRRNADKQSRVATPKRHTLDAEQPSQRNVSVHITDDEQQLLPINNDDNATVTITTRNSKQAITVTQHEYNRALQYCQYALLQLYNAAIDGYTHNQNHSAIALLVRRMDHTGMVSISPDAETLLHVRRMLLNTEVTEAAKESSDLQFLLKLIGSPDLSDPEVHQKMLQQVAAYDTAGRTALNDPTRTSDVQRSREQMSEWERKQYGINDGSDEFGPRSVLDKSPEPPVSNPFAWPLNLLFKGQQTKQAAGG